MNNAIHFYGNYVVDHRSIERWIYATSSLHGNTTTITFLVHLKARNAYREERMGHHRVFVQ